MERSYRAREARPAVEELAGDPSSRKRFLALLGSAGAVGAFSLLLAACGDEDDGEGDGAGSTTDEGANKTRRDREIVDYALTLEHVEADFYDAVIKSGVIKDQNVADTAIQIRENEREHVDALTKLLMDLGGNPKRPRTSFKDVIAGGPEKVLETADTVENLGAAAYLGQAPRIQSPDVLAAALSIHSVEGRHAAALNRVVGKTIVPSGAFAKPASIQEVLAKVKPFIVT